MPFIEYILLAILGSSPAAATGGSPRNFSADSITQPSGGVEESLDFNSGIAMLGQDTGGSTDRAVPTTGKKPIHHESARHHRTHKGKVIKTHKGKEARNSTSKS
jgi:hypothetical protein